MCSFIDALREDVEAAAQRLERTTKELGEALRIHHHASQNHRVASETHDKLTQALERATGTTTESK